MYREYISSETFVSRPEVSPSSRPSLSHLCFRDNTRGSTDVCRDGRDPRPGVSLTAELTSPRDANFFTSWRIFGGEERFVGLTPVTANWRVACPLASFSFLSSWKVEADSRLLRDSKELMYKVKGSALFFANSVLYDRRGNVPGTCGTRFSVRRKVRGKKGARVR